MPDWMVIEFFQPESECQRLSVHEYCESTSVCTMRRMNNLHLVDFVELQLKSKENFKQAFDIVLNTNLKLYMKSLYYYNQVIGHVKFSVDNWYMNMSLITFS